MGMKVGATQKKHGLKLELDLVPLWHFHQPKQVVKSVRFNSLTAVSETGINSGLSTNIWKIVA
jgi:hypothetical protein